MIKIIWRYTRAAARDIYALRCAHLRGTVFYHREGTRDSISSKNREWRIR